MSPLRRALPATVAVLALAASASPAGSRDEARIGLEDAHRFAAAFVAGDGLPTARALDAGYLRPATPALAAGAGAAFLAAAGAFGAAAFGAALAAAGFLAGALGVVAMSLTLSG